MFCRKPAWMSLKLSKREKNRRFWNDMNVCKWHISFLLLVNYTFKMLSLTFCTVDEIARSLLYFPWFIFKLKKLNLNVPQTITVCLLHVCLIYIQKVTMANFVYLQHIAYCRLGWCENKGRDLINELLLFIVLAIKCTN